MELTHLIIPALIGAGAGLIAGIVIASKKVKQEKPARRKVVRRVKRVL